jgi:nitrate reductase gamma subunit
MAVLPYVVAYAGIAIFIIAVIARFVMWSKMPMHVRWELYPVAHEGKKASYGGSFMEESEWWTKPREVSLVGELKAMVPEMLFLIALKEHNPKLWTRSFPFHFGLYLVGGCTALMVLGGVLSAVVPSLMIGAVGSALAKLIPVLGGIGLVLGILGAVGLLARRLTPPLRDYTAPADLFNLVFFIVAFGTAFLNFVLVDRDFGVVSSFVANLATFKMVPLADAGMPTVLPALSVVLLSAITAYIPLTHMSHFVGKYFAYHAIRWHDEPNLRGGKQEKSIQELLNQPVAWAAPHIKGDGKKTWLDVATEDQTK